VLAESDGGKSGDAHREGEVGLFGVRTEMEERKTTGTDNMTRKVRVGQPPEAQDSAG
jgi:hypothetical protein